MARSAGVLTGLRAKVEEREDELVRDLLDEWAGRDGRGVSLSDSKVLVVGRFVGVLGGGTHMGQWQRLRGRVGDDNDDDEEGRRLVEKGRLELRWTLSIQLMMRRRRESISPLTGRATWVSQPTILVSDHESLGGWSERASKTHPVNCLPTAPFTQRAKEGDIVLNGGLAEQGERWDALGPDQDLPVARSLQNVVSSAKEEATRRQGGER
ncbi:hypothetical protein BC567DRAFT_213016 [Phyllosticta citribraziliensis]